MLQIILKDLFTFDLILEVLASVCSITYSLLLMREKILGWIFGIMSSLISIVLFYHTKLYAQSLISIYYAVIGVYGWIYWYNAQQKNEHVNKWNPLDHFKYIGLFALLSLIVYGFFVKYTDASMPLLDSFITSFGFLASIKEARKILSSWIYWFVINILSAILYYSQGLNVYALLMIVYAGICIPGYFSWLALYKQSKQVL